MKTIRAVLIIFLMTFFVTPLVKAQFDNAGTSVANFLKIGVGARGMAMGSAYTASADDGSALYWNIAGISRIQNMEVFFAQTNWLVDISHSFIGVVLPIGTANTLGFSVNSIAMGEIEETTEYEPDGTGITFSGGDIALGIAFARSLSDRFSVGVKGKYIRETVAFSSADGVAIDIGTIYITQFNGLKIGMSLSNFGSKMRLRGREQLVDVDIDENLHSNPENITARLETEAWPIPMVFRLGTSLDLINNAFMRYTQTFDYYDTRDLEPIYATGAEISFVNLIALRAGLERKYFDWDNGAVFELYPTLGAGIDYKLPRSNFRFKMDMAYVDYRNAFDPIVRYSAALQF